MNLVLFRSVFFCFLHIFEHSWLLMKRHHHIVHHIWHLALTIHFHHPMGSFLKKSTLGSNIFFQLLSRGSSNSWDLYLCRGFFQMRVEWFQHNQMWGLILIHQSSSAQCHSGQRQHAPYSHLSMFWSLEIQVTSSGGVVGLEKSLEHLNTTDFNVPRFVLSQTCLLLSYFGSVFFFLARHLLAVVLLDPRRWLVWWPSTNQTGSFPVVLQ